MTTRLRVFAIGVLVAAALSACSGGRGAAAGEPSATGTASGSARPGASASSQTGSATAGSSGSTVKPIVLADLPLPKTGTYTYNTSVDLGPDSSYGGSRTLSFFRPSIHEFDADQYVRQTTAITGSQPKEWWFHYRWRNDGMFEVGNVQPSSGVCAFDHPVLAIKLPVRVGATWHSQARCVNGTGYSLDAKILRTESVTIAGTAVVTYVIDRMVTRGSTLHETWWFAPAYGINVKMRQQGTGDSPLDLRDTVRSLSPGKLPSDTPPAGF